MSSNLFLLSDHFCSKSIKSRSYYSLLGYKWGNIVAEPDLQRGDNSLDKNIFNNYSFLYDLHFVLLLKIVEDERVSLDIYFKLKYNDNHQYFNWNTFCGLQLDQGISYQIS